MLVIFLLSNREQTALGFWPFGYVVSLPVGAVVIVALILGFLAGLVFHLPKRIGAQRRANKAEKRIMELQGKLAAPLIPASGTTTTLQ